MAQKKEKKIRVTQIRSLIGEKPINHKTIEALGLKRIGHTREFQATPQILGMLRKVNHLVSCEEVK
jgi:large subunit ribosomal protein L30